MPKQLIPTEEQEQIWLFEWAALNVAQYPELDDMFHIGNGGLRSKSEAARFKAAGVKPGIPDICLPVARGGFFGLFIEMKRTVGGKVSKAQEAWIEKLRRNGYRVELCEGWQAAKKVIENYLGG